MKITLKLWPYVVEMSKRHKCSPVNMLYHVKHDPRYTVEGKKYHQTVTFDEPDKAEAERLLAMASGVKLRRCECGQVADVKKSNRWICSTCNEIEHRLYSDFKKLPTRENRGGLAEYRCHLAGGVLV